jgi:diguanylate cyclase (GGDEF)-like protein
MDWLRGLTRGQRAAGAQDEARDAPAPDLSQRLTSRVRGLDDEPSVPQPDAAPAPEGVVEDLLAAPAVPQPRLANGRLFGPARAASGLAAAPMPARESERRAADWHRDTLTGLAGKPLFRDRLAQAVAMADRAFRSVALLRLDVDGFLELIDRLGHPAGDAVLAEVGNRLVACTREYDTVARLSGEQFAVVQPFADQPRGAVALAERIQRALAEPFLVESQRVTLAARVGVALHPSDAASPEHLQHKAEWALERARAGEYRFADAETERAVRQARAMADELRVALQQDDLRLAFRPLCHCGGQPALGYVAHPRWDHPARGAVPPAEFVSAAEEYGLIARLGLWTLEAACMAAQGWEDPAAHVAVTLWAPQLRQRDLPGAVAHVLARSGLAPERLVIGVPEQVLASDEPEHLLATLKGLKECGVLLALDGFGGGQAGIAQLRRFPFDMLALDQTLMQTLEGGGEPADEAGSVVRASMALGLGLGIGVVFEALEEVEPPLPGGG